MIRAFKDIQYTLIRGFNDSEADAENLATLLGGIPVKINLIPLNEHKSTALRRPELMSANVFQKTLKKHKLVATIRFSKGRDIEAACGQLVQL